MSTIIDGRHFQTNGMPKAGVLVIMSPSQDDMSWALTKLGQNVPGRLAGTRYRFQAYIAAAGNGMINMIIEDAP